MTVQEVIEYLEQHGFIADEVKDMCIEALVQVEQYRALGTVEELKEAREKQPKADWIPCEERLPENDTNVIACFSCGTVTELRYLGNGIFQGIYEYNTKVIVAWQPLPQPYKKEGDSDAT